MKPVYKLVGYDKETERLAVAHGIPQRHVRFAKQVAGIDPNDATIVGDWPLTRAQARDIAGVIGATIDPERMDFFLEPYPERQQRASG